jgi:hypothetical protein
MAAREMVNPVQASRAAGCFAVPVGTLTGTVGAANKRASEMTGASECVEHQEGVCMASMKKEEARRAVLNEYDKWAKKHPDDAIMMGGFLFFRYLQNERSDLLDFRAVGDKWQIVHGWLRDWVKD